MPALSDEHVLKREEAPVAVDVLMLLLVDVLLNVSRQALECNSVIL